MTDKYLKDLFLLNPCSVFIPTQRQALMSFTPDFVNFSLDYGTSFLLGST